MDKIRCYFIEPTATVIRSLRRYRSEHPDTNPCPITKGYHDAHVDIGYHPYEIDPIHGFVKSVDQQIYADDPRWPTHCACGYEFTDIRSDTVNEYRQVDQDIVYRRRLTDEHFPLRIAPVGSIWATPPHFGKGPDGLCLIAKCPDGTDWMIDGRCNNCTEPCATCGHSYESHHKPESIRIGLNICSQFKRTDTHQCWTRNTDLDKLDVGKDYGPTCKAGAGSIQTGSWHGFLQNGFFVTA